MLCSTRCMSNGLARAAISQPWSGRSLVMVTRLVFNASLYTAAGAVTATSGMPNSSDCVAKEEALEKGIVLSEAVEASSGGTVFSLTSDSARCILLPASGRLAHMGASHWDEAWLSASVGIVPVGGAGIVPVGGAGSLVVASGLSRCTPSIGPHCTRSSNQE